MNLIPKTEGLKSKLLRLHYEQVTKGSQWNILRNKNLHEITTLTHSRIRQQTSRTCNKCKVRPQGARNFTG